MNRTLNPEIIRRLTTTYETYHRPSFLHMDPLCAVRDFSGAEQREIAGLIASSVAYGRVEQILRSVGTLFDSAQRDLHGFTTNTTYIEKKKALRGFVHRFNTGTDLALLFEAAARMIEEYGSLEQAFIFPRIDDGTMQEYADRFCLRLLSSVKRLTGNRARSFGYLLSRPSSGSACKRLNMYFRWMVRADDGIDCGAWRSVPSSMLIMPLDAHTGSAARSLGLTHRKSCDWKAAEDVTASLRTIDAEDPVRFDFSLCRAGMVAFRS